MIERLVESWLIKANERSYQIPFCHCLLKEGYRVVHLTRHTSFEMGKDVIAMAPDGVPCAFQLKSAPSGKVGLGTWRRDIQPQLIDLVDGALNHPSIDPNLQHRSYIVTNGEFEEEVLQSINAFNSEPARRNDPFRQINTIVKGELLLKFKQLGTDFWPPNYFDDKVLLRLISNSGLEGLQKPELSNILRQLLLTEEDQRRTDSGRRITAGAILTSFALSSYSAQNNHCAEFEGWTLYASHILAVAQKHDLADEYWKDNFQLAIDTIFGIMGRLCKELEERGDNLLEGNPLSDKGMEDVRITYLVGVMSCYGLFRKAKGLRNPTDDFIRTFCLKYARRISFWGEYAAPQLLSFFLYYKTVDASLGSDNFIKGCIETIIGFSNNSNPFVMASPYYLPEDILSRLLGVNSEPLNDNFKKLSFVLEGFFHLYVRLNWKMQVAFLWPDISRFQFREFRPSTLWQFYLWQCENGENIFSIPPMTKKWEDLKVEAHEHEGAMLPDFIKTEPLYYMCFLITFPHRWNSSGVRWLEKQLRGI